MQPYSFNALEIDQEKYLEAELYQSLMELFVAEFFIRVFLRSV